MALPFENDTSTVVGKLAKRSIRAQRRRSLMIGCTIAFAVALMAGLSFLTSAQTRKLESDNRGQYQALVPVTREQVGLLSAQPEVERWGVSKSYTVSRYQDSVLTVLYADDNWMALGNKPSVVGRMPRAEQEILVEEGFLDYFQLPQKTGQTITLDLGFGLEEYTVTGILQVLNYTRLFEVIVSRDFVEAHSGAEDELEFRLRYRGGEQMEAGRLKEAISSFLAEYGVPEENVIWSATYFAREGLHGNQGGYLIPAALVILFACGMVIYSMFYISVQEKRKEYGRLKVLGATPRQLREIVRRESWYLSLLGIPCGLLAGGIFAFSALPSYWSWVENAKIAVLLVVVTEGMIRLSTHAPVRMAARVSPIEAVRSLEYNAKDKPAGAGRPDRRLTPHFLARMYFERSRKKAVVTLVSLSLTGVFLLTVATVIRSANFENMAATMMGDGASYTLNWQDAVDMEEIPEAAKDNPLDAELGAALLSLPGVEGISTYEASAVEIALPRKSGSFMLVGMTREQLAQHCSTDQMASGAADYGALVEHNGILISDSTDGVLDRYGYAPQVGDVLHIKTYGGNDVDLTVMGIVKVEAKHITGVLGALFILPDETLHRLYPHTENLQMAWNVHTSEDSNELRRALFQSAEEPSLAILARSDLAEWAEASMGQAMALCYLFTAFLFAFALVNLVNTLMTNLLARRQEFGVLQSVGMTGKQLAGMLSMECLWYVAGTLVFTVIIGGGCGAALVRVVNQFKIFGTLSYCFPFWELLAFAAALWAVQALYVLTAVRHMRTQPLVERIKEAG